MKDCIIIIVKRNARDKRRESERKGMQTENAIMKLSENGMTEIESEKQQSSESEGTKEIQLEVLKSSSEILREGVLDSMIYADNAMSELSSQMENISEKSLKPENRTNSLDKVAASAGCAKTIVELINAKTNAMKLLKKIK